jgi:hypothetical protein
MYNCPTALTGVGVGVRLAADSQSTSKSGYRASFLDPWPDFILLFFRLTVTSFCLLKASSLTRKRVCNLLLNCFWALPEQSHLSRSPTELTAISYFLLWDSPNLEGRHNFIRTVCYRSIEWNVIRALFFHENIMYTHYFFRPSCNCDEHSNLTTCIEFPYHSLTITFSP